MTRAQLARLEACRAAGMECANRWQQGNGKTPLVCGFIMAGTACPYEITAPASEVAEHVENERWFEAVWADGQIEMEL